MVGRVVLNGDVGAVVWGAEGLSGKFTLHILKDAYLS
jgi:hypothetical protein